MQKYSIRPIAFRPELVDLFGDIETALYFQQIVYWSDKGSREDGLFYKTVKDFQYEITLSRYKQERARKKLLTMNLIECKNMRTPSGLTSLHFGLTETGKEIAFGNASFLHSRNASFLQSGMRVSSNPSRDTESTNREYSIDSDSNDAVKHDASKQDEQVAGKNDVKSDDAHKACEDAVESVAKPSKANVVPEGFETFWEAYGNAVSGIPRKVGKQAAKRAFPRALKHIPLDVMLKAIEEQANTDQWQNGFQPHASTWLNQERWEDDVESMMDHKKPSGNNGSKDVKKHNYIN